LHIYSARRGTTIDAVKEFLAQTRENVRIRAKPIWPFFLLAMWIALRWQVVEFALHIELYLYGRPVRALALVVLYSHIGPMCCTSIRKIASLGFGSRCKARFLIVAIACYLALFANENRLKQVEGFSRWFVK
jgi:hypothetical protein